MATITTRAGKGSALTFNEVDDNFTNLNSDGISNAAGLSSLTTTVSGKVSKAGDTMTGALVNQGVVSHEYANNNATGSLVTLATPTTSLLRLTNASLASVAGIGAGVNGQLLKLINKTGNVLSIANESSSATAVARIQTGTAADITLSDNASLSLVYDSLSGRWNIVGSAAAATSSGGINYITNGLAAADTTGWNTYADAAGSQPVDGAGGTPNVLWTRSTSTPLRGIADFNFEKDAANRQGQGVSVDFTIDQADLAKVLTVSFDYQVFNAAYTTGDLAVYIIADPNGTPQVIQPAGYQIQQIAGALPGKHIATFQTSSSITSYRLCIHVATTNANTYILALDNVSVGPQVVQYGAAVTEWKDWTPTGTWVSNATYTGKYRIVGDIMEFRVNVACSGAVTAANLTVNLPSGFSIDTSKLVQFTAGVGSLGYGSALNAGTSFHGLLVNINNTTSVGVYVANSAGTYITNGNVSNTVPFTFGAGDAVDLVFSAPILGLGATVQMSSDTDTRVVAASYRKTSSQAVTGNTTDITFQTSVIDTHGAFNGSAFVAPVPGVYDIGGVIGVTSGSINIVAFVNGVSRTIIGTTITASNTALSGLVVLNAGDSLTIRSESSITVFGQASGLTSFFSVKRLSGPSAIAASETVAASYWASTNGTANTTTPINFDSREFDSHGAVTTGAGWKFTAPIAGTYQLGVSVNYTSATAASFFIHKNNSASPYKWFMFGATSTLPAASTQIKLLAGETIDIRPGVSYPYAGGTLAATSSNFWIERVGN